MATTMRTPMAVLRCHAAAATGLATTASGHISPGHPSRITMYSRADFAGTPTPLRPERRRRMRRKGLRAPSPYATSLAANRPGNRSSTAMLRRSALNGSAAGGEPGQNGSPRFFFGPDDPNAMDFSLIRVRGQLSGRASSSGLVVAERHGYGRGPGVAPGRAAGSTSGCFGQGIREGRGQAAAGRQMLTWAAAVRVVTPRPAAGNAGRVLVLRSRCLSRPVTMRRLPRSSRVP